MVGPVGRIVNAKNGLSKALQFPLLVVYTLSDRPPRVRRIR